MKNSKFTKSWGFTLIEVILSMAILTVLGVVGVSYLGGYRKSANITSEAEKITAYLRQAQNRAISGEAVSGQGPTDWGVHFVNSASGEEYYALFRGSSYGVDVSVETVYLSNQVRFLDPAASSTKDIVFQRISGRPVATTTIILQSVANSDLIRSISINSLGQVNY
ncbi:MAG TPA: prepilin-type N-terminal cleavage/methylation domain-containing protein [Candidatus Paceibacterota bacterium]|nr:prepilin-type N-terminal cleavage/methylation domain-containing protein [Candidatus Paceibacterota bacterium]